MKEIVIFALRHSEYGQCSKLNLEIYLEKTKPEVIFYEASDDDSIEINDEEMSNSMDVNTIRDYKNKYNIEVIQINPKNPVTSTIRFKIFDEIMKNENLKKEYALVNEFINKLCYEFGYKWLNTTRHDILCAYKNELVNETIKGTDILIEHIVYKKFFYDVLPSTVVKTIKEYDKEIIKNKGILFINSNNKIYLIEYLKNHYKEIEDVKWFPPLLE
jgi:hypothetical protein